MGYRRVLLAGQIVKGIKPGPRPIIVDFAGDTYDVGGRMDDAREFGPCMQAFIENGMRQGPCKE